MSTYAVYVCDLCGAKEENPMRSVGGFSDELFFEDDDEVEDVCDECAAELAEAIEEALQRCKERRSSRTAGKAGENTTERKEG